MNTRTERIGRVGLTPGRVLARALPTHKESADLRRKPNIPASGKVRKLFISFLGFLLLLLTSSTQVNSQTVPFVEPPDGRAPIVAALNQANLSLDFYIFRLTLPANDSILDSIRTAVARGVIVRALLEPCPGDEADVCAPPNADARGACELLTQNGAAVKWANPTFSKTHAKSALIDNVRTLIMTLNLVPQTFTARRDYGVLTDDLGVTDDLARVFAQDWFAQDPFDADIITDCSLPPARNPDGAVDVYPTLIISPDNGRDQMIGSQQIPGLILFAQAPGFLKIQMEKMDPQDARGILPAIVDRIQAGVGVRVLLKPPTPSEPDNGVVAQRIVTAGGEARCQSDLHAKMILADTPDGQKAFVGSQNLTRASLDRRREVGWVTPNAVVRSRLQQTFDSDWAAAVSCLP